MATNKEKNADLSAVMYTTSGSLLAGSTASTALTSREAGIRALGHEQSVVMETLQKKAAVGIGKIEELHERGAEEYQAVADHHGQLTDSSQGTTYGHYVSEYNKRDLQQAAKHLSGAVEVGAYVIAQEISQSVVPPHEPKKPEKPGLLRRLTGDY